MDTCRLIHNEQQTDNNYARCELKQHIMPVIEPSIRPPAERSSFLLQVTTGCSSDTCTFCAAYKGKTFTVKDTEEIVGDIDRHSKLFPGTRRVFLMDGDALAVGNDSLVPLLERLSRAFPGLARVSSYANGYNISRRSDPELEELRENKLRLVYVGLESGNQGVLDSCKKRSGAEEMTEAVIRARKAGIKASVIVLLGLGGREASGEHVRDTIKELNRMQPAYLSFLSLMLIPGTEMYDKSRRGKFRELNSGELLREARDILSGLNLNKTVFRSDHASNYLSLRGRLPRDKHMLVERLDLALNGELDIRPGPLRGL
ncbi:MAG: radical SAM protein [Candidatus Omnitrophica bacterium]|nr:radical SAM protein [Candidatus Omnitrophota bacterium]